MWNNKTVSIVFPAYNEEENIAQAVADFLSVEVVDDVIVVDNNSTDRTAERAAAAGARVIREKTQGFGAALTRGLREAQSDLIVLSEPDGTFVARDVIKLLSYGEDFDMVAGTRTRRELIWEHANMGWFLRLGNAAVARMIELLFNGPSLSDCGCTFRLINKAGRDEILPLLTVKASHFIPEMIILCLRSGLRVIEIPVNYRKRIGTSKITGTFKGAFTTGMGMIFLILGYRFKISLLRRAPRQDRQKSPVEMTFK
jgi:glycosyltransferase involved in cell wall biosynthesis